MNQIKEVFNLKIYGYDDEYSDSNFMTIKELVSYDLLNIDLKELSIAYTYCAIQNNKEISEIFSCFEFYEHRLSLNDVFIYGLEEIKNIKELL